MNGKIYQVNDCTGVISVIQVDGSGNNMGLPYNGAFTRSALVGWDNIVRSCGNMVLPTVGDLCTFDIVDGCPINIVKVG